MSHLNSSCPNRETLVRKRSMGCDLPRNAAFPNLLRVDRLLGPTLEMPSSCINLITVTDTMACAYLAEEMPLLFLFPLPLLRSKY